MSIPSEANPAKLVIGLFMHEKGVFERAVPELVPPFGPVDMVSAWFPFNETDYYVDEMGSPLFRRFVVFSKLIAQDRLAEVKVFTNALEGRLSREGKRTVNVDPGYVAAERFVLATGKNFTHRIYLGSGIYGDLTLVYHKGQFQPLHWTYPDYAGEPIRGFLQTVRARYMYQLKGGLLS